MENVQMTIGTTCWGSEVLSVWDQVQSGFCHIGNLYPSTTDPAVQEAATLICQKLASLLGIDCPWGIDAVLTKDHNGKTQLSVVDVNVARFCGGHYPSLFGQAHGITMKCWLASKSSDAVPELLLNSDVVKKPLSYSRCLWYILA